MEYTIKGTHRAQKLQARKQAMPVNGLGYVRLITNILGKNAKAAKEAKR